jgi:hypothetical protein
MMPQEHISFFFNTRLITDARTFHYFPLLLTWHIHLQVRFLSEIVADSLVHLFLAKYRIYRVHPSNARAEGTFFVQPLALSCR